MQIDILLSNVKVYDINRFDVVLDEKFSLISDDTTTDYRWFSDNDEVLNIVLSSKSSADVTATKEGQSTILIMDSSLAVIKTLTVSVKKSLEVATSLNISAGTPVVK